MRILISQIEYSRPPRNFVFDGLERSYYKLFTGHDLIPVPNLVKVPYNDYDCLVLTGGPDSTARHETENLLYQNAIKNNKPILGICHGAFAINDICGGTNGYIANHVDADIEITMEGKKHIVKCFHSQAINVLGRNFIPLAHDTDGNIEAFKHTTLEIYGVLWHPERMEVPVLPSEVIELFD